MKMDLIPLSKLKPSPRNPKGHDLGGIHTSLDRFGWQGAIIVKGNTGIVVAGHGRTEALAQKKARGDSPPTGIEVDESGDWLVPAVRGHFKTAKEAEAYLLADNRWVELGGWDNDELVAMLQDLAVDPDGLEGVGWDAEDLDELLSRQGLGALAGLDHDDGYQEQYGVIVLCEDSAEQEQVYERLRGEGFNVRVVTT